MYFNNFQTLGVSVRTIRRTRMKDAGLYMFICTVSYAQLDEVVRNVFQQFPKLWIPYDGRPLATSCMANYKF